MVPVGLTKYNNMLKTGDLPPLRHYTREEAGAVIERTRLELEDEAPSEPPG